MAWGYDAMAGADDWIAQRRRREIEDENVKMRQLQQQREGQQFALQQEQHAQNTEDRAFDRQRLEQQDAAKAAEQEQRGLFLASLPPEMQKAIQAKQYGLTTATPHDFEDPTVHGQHEQADRDAELADYEAKEKIQARYRPQPQAPKSTADTLAEYEAKKKIDAQYTGARPSLGTERQTLAYYNRAKQASDDIGGLEDRIAGQGLMGQIQGQWAPNMMQTEEQQLYRQGQRAFTEARLRKESGAAIPTAEYENDARTYFAQPGDGPEVIQQKRRARGVVLEGLKNSAGRAYQEHFGEEGGTPPPDDAAGGLVLMVAPDGRRLNVPADKVAELEAAGAKRQ